MHKKLYISLVIACFSLFGLQAQPFISAELDTDKTLIGKPVQLSLTAEFKSGLEYSWPTFIDSINGLEIWESGQLITKDKKGITHLSQTFNLASFDSGFYIIKPIPFALGLDTLYTDPTLVQVNTIKLKEEQEIYDIKEPRSIDLPWLYILLAAAGVLAIIIALIYFLKKRKPKLVKSLSLVTDKRTPLERFNDDLKDIRSKKSWETNSKQFYSALSEAVKTYLEVEERIAALESTTQEIKPEIMALQWASQYKVETIEMLKEGDMVKFAKATSSPEAQTQHLLNMETLLQTLTKEEAARQSSKNQNV
jgi:hypothetical protein